MEIRLARVLEHEPLLLGESPAWDAHTATLSLVDIDGRALLTQTDKGFTRTPTSDYIGCAVPWAPGLHLAAVGTEILGLTAEGSTVPVARLPGDPATYRANDGKCDPAGRFWVGVMARDAAPAAGSVCVVHGDGHVETVLTGLTIPNGLGWSPEGTTMYVTDTAPGTITAYDYDPIAGVPSNPRTLITIERDRGGPDGLTVDSTGHLWTALWDGGAVLRISPDGTETGAAQLLVKRLASCCFAGPDLTDLVVTTGKVALDEDALRSYPQSGATFVLHTDVTGLPTTRFQAPVPRHIAA